MEPRKSIPIWLHAVRILTLVAAAAGIAWVVASAQRRANHARAERQSASEMFGDVTEAAEEPLSDEGLTLEEIQAEIARFDHPNIELDPLEIDTPDSSQPPQPFQFKVKLLSPVHTYRFFSSTKAAVFEPATAEKEQTVQFDVELVPPVQADPYMSSSKSMVFEPAPREKAHTAPKHGKP